MSHHHVSRRKFVSGLGLGIAGLSIGGEARADELFGRRLDRRRNTSCVTRQQNWEFIPPKFNETGLRFGFLTEPHDFFDGVPIIGFPQVLAPTTPTDPASAPAKLEIKNTWINPCESWTGGNFGVYITRTPTLFHALHFKSNPGRKYEPKAEPPFGIEPRYEERIEKVDNKEIRHGNITEADFMVDNKRRYPLKGRASEAGPKLFDVAFDERGSSPTIEKVERQIPFEKLDSRDEVDNSIKLGYFDTIHSSWNDPMKYVGPLNAIWLFIVAHNDGASPPSLPIARLGDGYRFWHVLDEDTRKPNGYRMDAFKRKDAIGTDNEFRRIKFEIELSGALNKGRKECPDERVVLSFEIEWI